MRALVLLLLMVAGCNRAPLESSTVEHDARFAGLWMIDQPTHSGYEASLYDFAGDGALAHVRSFGNGWPTAAEETGVVGKDALSCSFGAGWRSKGGEILIVDGDCSDGRARAITLGLFGDATLNTIDAPIEVLTVGEEPGWEHLGWPWRFRKCGADDCHIP